ncbi:MAG: metalloregulator ArsR/SmtB family transcription factor, partial [Chloroflexota bacterium]
MNENTQLTELLAFFKALSDANRLKIVGLLAQSDYSVEELAAILALRPSTVSHHLARLTEVGLVSARAESYYSI